MNALGIATGGMITPSLCALLARRARFEGMIKPAPVVVAAEACAIVARVAVAPKVAAPVSHQLFPGPVKPTVQVSATAKTATSVRVSVGQKAAAPLPPAPYTQVELKPTVKVKVNGGSRPKLKVKE